MVNIQYRKEPLKGYPGYQIDTLGNVYNKNGTIKKHSVNWNGYHVVNFSINGQQKGASVHSLVAKQFIPNEDPAKNQVNHKDGDKSNNKVENLEWVTALENSRHAIEVLHRCGGGHNKRQVAARVNADDICEMVFPSEQVAATYLGHPNGRSTVWQALKGLRKRAYGYLWRYYP